ncbi:GTP-binding protein 2 [Auxenochlorella protothecoides]|uniref:GTP-binding protein 2 n=1 Tax=Auxenochlorella protothecoides TaxID=3075 RepID=A0A087SM97_AUXPR|nr:GTP-binding protein 2 [Auxenochlorella protothecoides]KFM26851.1 GTP-binding protein 2 [Auxenochlorella protothecoides]
MEAETAQPGDETPGTTAHMRDPAGYGRAGHSPRNFGGPPLLVREQEDGPVEYKLRLDSVSHVRFQQLVGARDLGWWFEDIAGMGRGAEVTACMEAETAQPGDETPGTTAHMRDPAGYGRAGHSPRNFGGPPLLVREQEDGPVEYKLRLDSVSHVRFQQLVTQLQYRLSEGEGACVYYLGLASGRTSSAAHVLLGYDAQGRVLNRAGVSPATAPELGVAAHALVRLVDAPGDERHAGTLLRALCAGRPALVLLSNVSSPALAVPALPVSCVDGAGLHEVHAMLRALPCAPVPGAPPSPARRQPLRFRCCGRDVAHAAPGTLVSATVRAAGDRARGDAGSGLRHAFGAQIAPELAALHAAWAAAEEVAPGPDAVDMDGAGLRTLDEMSVHKLRRARSVDGWCTAERRSKRRSWKAKS